MSQPTIIYDGTSIFISGYIFLLSQLIKTDKHMINKLYVHKFDRKIKQILSCHINMISIFILDTKRTIYTIGNIVPNSKFLEKHENFDITFLDTNIKKIVSGDRHIIISKPNGIYSFGYNNVGQLGLGHNNETNFIQQINFMSKKSVCKISCGYGHTLFTTTNNELYSFGHNVYGQLGLCDNIDRFSPTLVTHLTSIIIKISCGYFHTLLLDNLGKLYSCGLNMHGQLGLGDIEPRNRPSQMLYSMNIKQIECGSYNTFILINNGDLFTTGLNDCGQLGLGDNNNRNKPTLLMSNLGIHQIVCLDKVVYILKKSGQLLVFGNNKDGQLGLGDNINKNRPTLLMTNDNILMINGTIIKKIKWKPEIYVYLSERNKKEILFFLQICKKNKIKICNNIKNIIIQLII